MSEEQKNIVLADDSQLIALAQREGFSAAIIATQEVPVDAKFRAFCEENRCGQYNTNYSCPPTCGTPAQMHGKILAGTKALVLKSEWQIEGYEDTEGIRKGKNAHNAAMLRLNEALGHAGLCLGGSCCSLCEPCGMASGVPCPHPTLRFSCMSAYCVDVAELAKRCGMAFTWDPHRLTPFSMIVFP